MRRVYQKNIFVLSLFLLSVIFTNPLFAEPPGLVYSTYFGGNGYFDEVHDITVDASGNIYLVGDTDSTDFPLKNPLQASNAGDYDIFIAKLSPSGDLLYSTYFGGSGQDRAYGIALGPEGNIFITGQTGSHNFPIEHAFQTSLAGSYDAFVAKLSSDGSSLIYSSYLGGEVSDYMATAPDNGYDIAVDSFGNAYVAGITSCSDFPLASPFQGTYGANTDAFIAKIGYRKAHDGGNAYLVYSTYLGGGERDEAVAIALDADGNVYVTGPTSSPDFPTEHSFQAVNNNDDAFVAKLNADGSVLIYSTYLGGSSWDTTEDIAVDAAGSAYVIGTTDSSDFPTENPFQPASSNYYDAFVTKFSVDGGSLVYSTYLGGNDWDGNFGGTGRQGIAVNVAGNVYVTGYTESTDLPVINAVQPEHAGNYDLYVAKFGVDGSSLVYLTYLGGTAWEVTGRLAIDSEGAAYLTGRTNSSDFPLVDPFQSVIGEGYDAYVTKITDVVEECDGIDNDGDGTTDEGFPNSDGDLVADCMDIEQCDGLDNDGDTFVDEGFADNDGDGIANCVDIEECDGVDNDGDGTIDEGVPEEPDGLDNDCDEITDEDFFSITLSPRNPVLDEAGMLSVDYTVDNATPLTQYVNILFLIFDDGALNLHPTAVYDLGIPPYSSLPGTVNIDIDQPYIDPLELCLLVGVIFNDEDVISGTTWMNYGWAPFFTL